MLGLFLSLVGGFPIMLLNLLKDTQLRDLILCILTWLVFSCTKELEIADDVLIRAMRRHRTEFKGFWNQRWKNVVRLGCVYKRFVWLTVLSMIKCGFIVSKFWMHRHLRVIKGTIRKSTRPHVCGKDRVQWNRVMVWISWAQEVLEGLKACIMWTSIRKLVKEYL